MADWLRHAHQPDDVIDRVWRTFVVSALNDQPENVDVHYARLVFWESLLKNRQGYRLGVPQVALADLWDPCRTVCPNLSVRTRSPVHRLVGDATGITGVCLADGTTIAADHVVVAVPPDRLAAILPPDVRRSDDRFRHVDRFRLNPIVAVHLWFDRPVLDLAHAYIMSPHVQWVFDVSAHRPATASAGQYLMAVLSAPGPVGAGSRDQLDRTLHALTRALPRARHARLVRHRVVRVTRATFAPVPGVDTYRPAHSGTTPNLVVAGDWTATGWPSTMESAVRSGYACAEAVLRAHGDDCTIVRPDLAAEGIARWWGA